jgi:hypothetical protein
MNQEKIQELELMIEELKKQLPAHSIPPSMLIELEDLEEELLYLKANKERP